MKMVTRQDITLCLIFLVMIMIMMNLYTLLIFWKSKFDQKLSDLRNQRNGNAYQQRRMAEDENVSSMRFGVSSNGEIQLLVPEKLPHEYFDSLKDSIMVNFQEESDISAMLAQMEESEFQRSLDRRLKRALGGWAASNGNDLPPTAIWKKLAEWPNSEKLIKEASLGLVLSFTSRAKIMQATTSSRGTQLKLELLLEGGQLAFFKPAWYPRDVKLRGDPYGGKDRHYGEIASFYLAQLLGFNSGPIVVGRKIDLTTEIFSYSTQQLKDTFFRSSSGNLCFYGVCYYCKKEDPVCSERGMIEGAVVLLMKQKLKPIPNPWRRTYKRNQFAAWERNMSYCQSVYPGLSPQKRNELLSDIVAASAFDFLIGNADRHHLDKFVNGKMAGHLHHIALLDNGKSFGDSEEDYLDILAPLYQCCTIRKALYLDLRKFRGTLGKSLDTFSAFDPLYPLLTPSHLNALDRRLKILISTIKVCHDYRST